MSCQQPKKTDESSLLHRNIPHLPAAAYVIHLSDYKRMDILHHWNEDFTILTVTNGNPVLQISGHDICLCPGDCVLINIRKKHRIYSPDHRDATLLCILASPQLILINFPNYLSLNDLAAPIYPEYYILSARTSANKNAVQMIKHIVQLNQNQRFRSSLSILGYLHLILGQFVQSFFQEKNDSQKDPDPDYRNLRRMQDYIHQHYQKKILLKQISSAGKVCDSKCCSLFQKYLHQRPMEYVNSYRLSISRRYLVDSSATIADIASSCGFSNQSYYSKLFVSEYGFTPNEYRKQILAADDSGNLS